MRNRVRLRDVESIAQELAEEIVHSTPVTVATVALWDHPGSALAVKGVSSPRSVREAPPVGQRYSFLHSRWHRVVLERQEPVLLEEGRRLTGEDQDEWVGWGLAQGLDRGFRSVYLLPMKIGDTVVGVLDLREMRDREREPFSPDRQGRIRATLDEFLAGSAHAWEAVRLRSQVHAMSSLFRLAEDMRQARSYENVLACSVRELAEWLGTRTWGVLFKVGRTGMMALVAREGFDVPLTEEDGQQLLLCLARGTDGVSLPIGVTDVSADSLDPVRTLAPQDAKWTRLTVPLMNDMDLVGILCFYVHDELHLSEWDAEAFRRRGEMVVLGMSLAAGLLERQSRQSLEQAARELATEHQRTVVGEVLRGVLDMLPAGLQERVNRLRSTKRVQTEVDAGLVGQSLGELVARESAAMISELLSRVVSDDRTLRTMPINAVLGHAIEIARTRWIDSSDREAKVELTFEPSREYLVVETSLELVGAVLHLIENAVEAMPNGGRVELRTWRDDEHVLIAIRDDGAGVPEHQRGTVFAPLYTTKGKPHLGLGLSVVRSVVGRHGGSVTFAPSNLGSELQIRLPASKGAIGAVPAQEA